MRHVQLYDTTLRDGAQRQGISFSVEDKLKIVRKLDELGIHYIEGGWPGATPKDVEFFTKAHDLSLSHATLVAFGSTRRPKSRAERDPNLRALLKAGTKVATLVGKSWDAHVTDILGSTLEDNLDMVADSINYLKAQGLRVFFDAEHFFDGYKANPDYALEVIRTAANAGAEVVVLCDTNGGVLPHEVTQAVRAARQGISVTVAIHAHNDGELAVANSLAAVQAGAAQVQGTINGYGERCGNANLCSIIPTLKLKMKMGCITDKQLARLTEVSRYVSEIANLSPDAHLPYVGASAFSHKADLYVSKVMEPEESYQHVDPSLVGNRKRARVFQPYGKSNILHKAKETGLDLTSQPREVQRLLDTVRQMESLAFQYGGAEASLELLLRRAQPGYRPPFELVDFIVLVEKRRPVSTRSDKGEELLAEAIIKIKVGSQVVHIAAEGNGPVNAVDGALRKALLQFYPELAAVKLLDYKVRIPEESSGSGSLVHVFIKSGDGEHEWHTLGSSANVIEASWLALADSLEYWLLRKGAERR
jgi:2-isopropylmalate synthase